MIEENKIEKLLNKYKENRKVTNEQLDKTREKLVSPTFDSLDEDEKDWLHDDWNSTTGQISVYDCVIRDLEKLLGRKEDDNE